MWKTESLPAALSIQALHRVNGRLKQVKTLKQLIEEKALHAQTNRPKTKWIYGCYRVFHLKKCFYCILQRLFGSVFSIEKTSRQTTSVTNYSAFSRRQTHACFKRQKGATSAFNFGSVCSGGFKSVTHTRQSHLSTKVQLQHFLTYPVSSSTLKNYCSKLRQT